jgi:cyanophycin synthetase
MQVVARGEAVRVNAKLTDCFDVFDLHHCVGPNPWLGCPALVFDLAVTGDPAPLPVPALRAAVAARFPELSRGDCPDYATLFARTVVAAGQLDMGLGLERYSLQPVKDFHRIAVETLHSPTQWDAVFLVWDWFEALSQQQPFDLAGPLRALQAQFSRSSFGGPTAYALLRAAARAGVPTLPLRDEGQMQYGYGRKSVRGVSTTFDRDSHLDSDFTTAKDACKALMASLGYPVPGGDVVDTLEDALRVVTEIGYPVAVKPLDGHKGIGVTAGVRDADELAFAFAKAVEASIGPQADPTTAPPPSLQPPLPGKSADLPIGKTPGASIIVERFITGFDFRLLCVGGEFVAATRREPASVTGDGVSTIRHLIAIENARPQRADTPISPLAKVLVDDQLLNSLASAGVTLDTVPAHGHKVWLRKVANLSLGGVSADVTDQVHPDTVAMCRAISGYLRLTCLGIDVIAADITRSWRDGDFGIIEINAAPGIFMHLHPAEGRGVDAPGRIIQTFFKSGRDGRIPIVTANALDTASLRGLLDQIQQSRPSLVPGGLSADAMFVGPDRLPLSRDHTASVRALLRNPRLDLLICEYPAAIFAEDGLLYQGSDLILLDEPTATDDALAHHLTPDAIVLRLEGGVITRTRHGQTYTLDGDWAALCAEAVLELAAAA